MKRARWGFWNFVRVVKMAKAWQGRLVLLISILVFCGSANGFAQESKAQWLVSPELLKSSELEILWETRLPIKTPETLEQLFILGNRIYSLSDLNYMVCLNRERGNVIFSKPIAEADFPVVGLEHYKGELFSVAGNELIEIGVEFGKELGTKRLKFGVTCPVARNSSYYYVAGSDKRLHALRVTDKVQVFEVATVDDSMITSVIAEQDFVIFSTESGSVISITADGPKRLWQFDAADRVAESLAKDANSLFIASKDTNVYRINILNGKLVWKYQTGAMLEKGPVVTDEIVYQYVRSEGLVAIDKKSGKLIWKLAEGVDLLAEANGESYVITKDGKMAVMDNKKAKQVRLVDFAGVSRYAVNVVDLKIYVADKSGRIACLKPIE